jgi:hypothetical protein
MNAETVVHTAVCLSTKWAESNGQAARLHELIVSAVNAELNKRVSNIQVRICNEVNFPEFYSPLTSLMNEVYHFECVEIDPKKLNIRERFCMSFAENYVAKFCK